MPMELAVREDGRVTIIAVSGDLVAGDSEVVFKKTVSRLLEEGKVGRLAGEAFGDPFDPSPYCHLQGRDIKRYAYPLRLFQQGFNQLHV